MHSVPDPPEKQKRNPKAYVEPPPIPISLDVHSALVHFMPAGGDDGGMIMIFTPAAAGPNGPMLGTPQIRVYFSEMAWETHQREVANDGVQSRIIKGAGIPVQ